MNAHDLNTLPTDLLKAMQSDSDSIGPDENRAYYILEIEPAVRFVLHYWADPRPVWARDVMHLCILLADSTPFMFYDEATEFLMRTTKSFKSFLADLHWREAKALAEFLW